jgi:hypothetical protein
MKHHQHTDRGRKRWGNKGDAVGKKGGTSKGGKKEKKKRARFRSLAA